MIRKEIEIGDLEDPVAFTRVLKKDGHIGDLCIDGRFVYPIKHKSLKAGHTKNGCIYR